MELARNYVGQKILIQADGGIRRVPIPLER